MGEYDVLFAVVLRLSDFDGRGMEKKMDKSTKKLGNIISDIYPDCCIVPVGFEEVDDEQFLNILTHFEFTGNMDE